MAEKLLREKIGWKPGMRVLVAALPEGLASPFSGVEHTSLRSGEQVSSAAFDLVLGFAQDSAALAKLAPAILSAGTEDVKLWICYPKLSSKVKTDLTRDAGWELIFQAGWIVVAIASVDAVWSAVRFRPKVKVKSTRFS